MNYSVRSRLTYGASSYAQTAEKVTCFAFLSLCKISCVIVLPSHFATAQTKGTFVVSEDTQDSIFLAAFIALIAFMGVDAFMAAIAFMGLEVFMIAIAFIALVGFDVFMAVIVFMALMAAGAFWGVFIAFVFIAFIATIARDQFGPLQAGQQPGRNTTLGTT